MGQTHPKPVETRMTEKTVIHRSHAMPFTLPEHSNFTMAAHKEPVSTATQQTAAPKVKDMPLKTGWHDENLNLND